MIELIIFAALISALVIQSDRAARRERELAQCQEAYRLVLDELRHARAILAPPSR
jgi:hypothetical protein